MAASNGDLIALLERAVTDEQRALLDAVRQAAAAEGLPAFLVGGRVRDLLLGAGSPDLDVTVVGDAVGLARRVEAALGLQPPAVHEAFRTATVRAGNAWVDLITARREVYRHPGALPEITPAGIGEDLARRDFTINAMALAISGDEEGRLVDPHRGRVDLAKGYIRVLHDRSFEDDATRLLRAARYAGRFGFRLDERTARAAERSRRFLATISPARVRHEMLRAFQEERPVPVMECMQRLSLPDALLQGMTFEGHALSGWRRLGPADWSRLPLAWAIGALGAPPAAMEVYATRFELTRAEARAVRALPAARAMLSALARRERVRASEIVAALERIPPETLEAVRLACGDGTAAGIAARFLGELRVVRPALTSERLKELGVPKGPIFGTVRRRLRDARLDDPTLSLDAEVRLVQDMLNALPGA